MNFENNKVEYLWSTISENIKKAKEYEDAQIGIKSLNEKSKTKCDKAQIELMDINDENGIDEMMKSFDVAFKGQYTCDHDIKRWKTNKKDIVIYKYVVNKQNLNKRIPVTYAIVRKKEKQKVNDLLWFWTNTKFQGNGYGEQLLDFLVTKSQKNNLQLVVTTAKIGAKLYKKLLCKQQKGKYDFKSTLSNRLYENIKICKKLRRSNSYGLLKTDENKKKEYGYE